MRTRLLSLIAFAAVALASCKKETDQLPAAQPNPLLGTWSIVKINSATLNGSGQQVNTVTYQQPLSSANYVKFNDDNTAQWKTDHFYVFGENEPGVVAQSDFKETSFVYQVKGNSIALSVPMGAMPPMGPNAVFEYESATLESANSLVIHSVYQMSNDGSTITADTYYSK